jgi:hypothetical protein
MSATTPKWTIVPGLLGMLLVLEFWVHALVPFVRKNVPFPFWPVGAIVDMVLSTVFSALAAIRGSRIWWISCFLSLSALALILIGLAA